MIYISIPVHEKPDVVVNQMQNFARYLPEAKVVLHVSKDAKFSVNELEDVLKKANVSHALVNPTQVETKWEVLFKLILLIFAILFNKVMLKSDFPFIK